eukprot:scaffold121514_cov17-Tisochrysis_lutea.AAC.1
MPPVCIRHRRPALIVISNGSSTSKIGSAQRGECKDPSNGIDVRFCTKLMRHLCPGTPCPTHVK